MNASVSVICYKQKILSNGENPLMLRICKDGKRTYQSLGISINPQFWDFKKNEPKLKCPDRERIIAIILKKKEAIQKKILEFNSEEKDYTVNSLLDTKERNIRCTVEEYYLQLIRQYEEADNRGNRRVYKASLNSLLSFSKNKLNVTFQEITVDWLEKYERWLRAKKNKETTISLLFRTLRSTYNKAIEDKYAKKAHYPFNEYKLSKFDVSTQKRAISKSDVMKIKDLDLTGQNFYIRFSREYFSQDLYLGPLLISPFLFLYFKDKPKERVVYDFYSKLYIAIYLTHFIAIEFTKRVFGDIENPTMQFILILFFTLMISTIIINLDKRIKFFL